MTQSYEPHRLVIHNMAVLESAPGIVDEVEKSVFGEIDEKVEKWVTARGDWEGCYDYLGSGTSFKASKWPNNAKGEYQIFITLGCDEYELLRHNLSSLIGAAPVAFGLWFGVDEPWITKLSGRGTPRPLPEWRKFLADAIQKTKLPAIGFEMRGQCLFLPIRVEAQMLAEDYPDSISLALTPVDEALDKLTLGLDDIEKLLHSAFTHFWREEAPKALTPSAGS